MDPSTSRAPAHHFTSTLRGGLKLWLDGFSYVKQKTSNGSGHVRFSCCQRQNLHCRGFLVTSEDLRLVLRSGAHNHVPVDQERAEQFPVEGWRELSDPQKLLLIEQVRIRPQLWEDVGKNLKNKKYWIDVAVMVLNTMELSAARICCNTFNILRQTMPEKFAERLSFLLGPTDKDEGLATTLSSQDALLDYLNEHAEEAIEEPPQKRVKSEPLEEEPLSPESSAQDPFPSGSQTAGVVDYGLRIMNIASELASRRMDAELDRLRTQMDTLATEMERRIAERDLEQSSWMP
uniref:FLYWCH-type domain-containing protein n=1 Tax=Steinernema glaseri TaxID=37863 RepID=A0A1I7YRH5_9BILA